MSHTATISLQNNSLVVSGELNFNTVAFVWNQSLPLLSQTADLQFDLCDVKSCNSAGVALMLEWVKYARSSRKTIRFQNVPEQLKSIISVSGISSLL